MLSQIIPALFFIEEPDELHAGAVIHGDHHVRIPGIVDPGHVLVPDPLDAVSPVSAEQKRRALEGFPGGDLTLGEDPLQIIPGSQGSGGTGLGYEPGEAVARRHHPPKTSSMACPVTS